MMKSQIKHIQESLSFDDVKFYVDALAKKIRVDGFRPNLLVGVARGGWIPARLLSDALDVKEILSVGVRYADQQRSRFVTSSSPHPFPKNEIVLIVEDHLESGRSLEYAKQLFEQANNTVRTAALFVAEKSVFISDYYIEKLTEAPTFPWE